MIACLRRTVAGLIALLMIFRNKNQYRQRNDQLSL